MNSCFAILLVLGVNPYSPAVVTAQGSAQGTVSNQTVSNQMVLIAVPAESAARYVQPQQLRPLRQQNSGQQIQLVQGNVLPPAPYEQSVSTGAMTPHAESYSESQPVSTNSCSSSSCGSGGCHSCGNSCDCSEKFLGLIDVDDLFGDDDCDCEGEKFRCWDSTFDMPQHYPYPPVYHGYYYYRPYNYAHVLRAKQQLLGDSVIAPYSSMVFEQLYADFPKQSFNPDPEKIYVDPRLPPAPKELPNLQDLVNGGAEG